MDRPIEEWMTRRVVASERVLVRLVDDQAVLLDSTTGRYFTLDAVGTRAWTLLTSLPSIAAVCETLSGEFAAEPTEVRRDVLALVDELDAAGLVEIQPA